jgi:predicted transcriptional regulator
MDDAHYTRIERLREELAEINERADKARDQLHEAIRDAFPETHGKPTQRGVLAEVARRSRYSREHVAQIRDGQAADDRTGGTR